MGRRGLWLLLTLCGAHGCSASSSAFSCDDSSQCESVGVAGTCEANGFCSFPDPECPSGRRYGDLAGPLSETCVEEGTAEGTDASSEASSGTTASTLGESTAGEVSTGGVETDALTSGPATGTTMSVEETGSDASTSTGGAVEGGLVGWWQLGDDPEDGMLDATGNGNDGVCLGPCPSLTQDGGYRFDGTQVIRIPGDALGTETFTVALWARPDTTASEIDPIVFTRPAGPGIWNAWGLHFDQNYAQFEFVIGNPLENTPVEIVSPDDGEWHHYAGRFDGERAYLFVDGIERISVAIPDGYYQPGDDAVYLGGDFDEGGPAEPRYSGDLDDIRYYDVALSGAEIEALASAPR